MLAGWLVGWCPCFPKRPYCRRVGRYQWNGSSVTKGSFAPDNGSINYVPVTLFNLLQLSFSLSLPGGNRALTRSLSVSLSLMDTTHTRVCGRELTPKSCDPLSRYHHSPPPNVRHLEKCIDKSVCNMHVGVAAAENCTHRQTMLPYML